MPRILLALICLFALPGFGAESYREVKTELIGDKQADMTTLKAFVKDERASLGDRIKAAKAYAKKAKAPKEVVKAQLLLARMYGLANKSAPRTKALKKAIKAAKKGKHKKARGAADRALKADKALALVEKETKVRLKAQRRARKKKSGAKTKALAAKVKAARKTLAKERGAYTLIGDKVREVRAEAAAVHLLAASGSVAKALKRAAKIVAAHPSPERELAVVLAGLEKMRATVYLHKKKYEKAALAAMAFDRLSPPPLMRAAFDTKKKVHVRSRGTSDMCETAFDHDVDCTRLELEKYSEVSVSDFSKRKQRRFDVTFAQRVFREYKPLLESCIETSDDLTEFDSEVTLQWTVLSNGRVESLDTRPRHLKMGATGQCLDQVVEKMRYPRFRGPPASVDYIIEVEHG